MQHGGNLAWSCPVNPPAIEIDLFDARNGALMGNEIANIAMQPF